MVGTATALLAAGCGATGTAGAGGAPTSAAGSTPGGGASNPTPPAVTGTALGGSAPASTAPAGKVTVYGCDGQPVAQPKTYILSCGDGGVVLNQLVWTGWGTANTGATGVQTQNNCVPTCAAGSPISTKATATLSGLTAGHYTTLHVVTDKGASDYTIDAHGPLAANAR